MTVQDDERERELAGRFNLVWDPAHERGGRDAYFDIAVGDKKFRIEVEIKSTTGHTVSTARDVGMVHIQKWRTKLWVIGFYSKTRGRPELQTSLCLTPHQMEPWIASIEEKIRPDFLLASKASDRLTLDDLKHICGDKEAYSIEDAKRLHKNQWTAEQYRAAADLKMGGRNMISPETMLAILKLRSKYIAERGATLNNPHVTKTHLKPFFGTQAEATPHEWVSCIRKGRPGLYRGNSGSKVRPRPVARRRNSDAKIRDPNPLPQRQRYPPYPRQATQGGGQREQRRQGTAQDLKGHRQDTRSPPSGGLPTGSPSGAPCRSTCLAAIASSTRCLHPLPAAPGTFSSHAAATH